MDLWNRPPARLLCTEPLEGRRLLAGSSPAGDAGATAGDALPAPFNLPAQILTALQARFPGALVLDAELDEDDGDPVYDVDTVFDGSTVEVTFTPSGEILEVEREPASEPGVAEDDEAEDGEVDAPVLAPEPVAVAEAEPAPAPDDAASPAPSSLPAPDTSPVTTPFGAIEVIEFGPGTDDGGDVEVAPADLPEQVIAGLNARFPGAEVIEAEFSANDGAGEFGITAQFHGELIEVDLTREGEVIEAEEVLASADLPPAVLEWVRRTVPGASIAEALAVTNAGGKSYEVLLDRPGEQAIEAVVRVQDQKVPRAPNSLLIETMVSTTQAQVGTGGQAGTESQTEATVSSAPSDSAQQAADANAPPPESAEADRSVAVADPGPPRQARQADVDPIAGAESDEEAAESWPVAATAMSGALKALVAGAAPAALLPQVAGVLGNALPLDVAAVERALANLLGELDGLADGVVGDTGADGVALRLALVAALVAGAELLLLDSRKRGAGPVLVFNAGHSNWSTWSWVLGSTTWERRRRDHDTSPVTATHEARL